MDRCNKEDTIEEIETIRRTGSFTEDKSNVQRLFCIKADSFTGHIALLINDIADCGTDRQVQYLQVLLTQKDCGKEKEVLTENQN